MSNECGVIIDVEEIDQDFLFELNEEDGQLFDIEYCVSYRSPDLAEWILARWYWNNLWIWIDEALWNDH